MERREASGEEREDSENCEGGYEVDRGEPRRWEAYAERRVRLREPR